MKNAQPGRFGARCLLALLACCGWASNLPAQTTALDVATLQWRQLGLPATPAGGPPPLPVELRVDDGTAEGQFGIGAAASRQFMWLQAFRPLDRFELRQVQVLFPPDAVLSAGAAVQIVIYVDPDRNPDNGAEFRLAFDGEVQSTGGDSFSVFSLPTPVRWDFADGDLLIGVVPRYISTGVTPLSLPAAFDSSAAGDSYIATWLADPPDPPELPSDQALFRLDEIVQGRWMIRGYGSPLPPEPVPALSWPGLLALLLLIVSAGAFGGRLLTRPGSSR